MNQVKVGYRLMTFFQRNVLFMLVTIFSAVVVTLESNRLVLAFEEMRARASTRYDALGDALADLEIDLLVLAVVSVLFIVIVILFFLSQTPVYLVDFVALEPDRDLQITKEYFMVTGAVSFVFRLLLFRCLACFLFILAFTRSPVPASTARARPSSSRRKTRTFKKRSSRARASVTRRTFPRASSTSRSICRWSRRVASSSR